MLIKTCCLLCFTCFTCVCFSQTRDTAYGVVITKIVHEGANRDTTRFLYVRNTAGNRLAVYTVAGGVVSAATAYQLTGTGNTLGLYSQPLLTDQQPRDSLLINFQDKAHTVVINRHDRYVLFPAYYGRFKAAIAGKHSVMVLLNLLSDGLGDYPIAAALPLVSFTPALAKQIQGASIVTQRSQSDLKDTWTCRYFYNQSQKLDSVIAASAEEIRFTKKVAYHPNRSVSINTWLNIESRQAGDRAMLYGINEHSPLKWRERYLETGKNRETTTHGTLSWHDLGMLRKQEPTNAEVMEILKPATLHPYAKEHID